VKTPKYIFVVGGVMSGVGKGVATASIARILKSRGLNVTALKIDPYVNVDAGTMNPTEHGEVFVLEDGTECDQDMGNYERFLDRDFGRENYMTTGSVYLSVIQKERNLEYGGRNVEVVPHIPLEVIGKIDKAIKKDKADVAITEIGGTVGEYQNILFLEAVRFLKLKHPNDVALVLVSYLPQQGEESELKTKPTQYAVRTLNASGLQPDFVLARAKVPIDEKRKEKIAVNCNMMGEDVISAPDAKSIYEVPVNFDDGGLTDLLMKKLGLRTKSKDMKEWRAMVRVIRSKKPPVRVAIVGKYFGSGNFILADSYISVIEAVKHAAYALKREPVIEWLNSETFEKNSGKLKELSNYDGVIIPGGFGSRGIEGKIAAIRYLREQKIPYFGLCYGMQLATVEFARNVAGLKAAHTVEANPKTQYPVIDIMPEQKKNLAAKNYGATMRLGVYPALLKKGSIAAEAYKGSRMVTKKSALPAEYALAIKERHRHRYEVNPEYITTLEKKGLLFSGVSPDRKLMEIIELPRKVHPFFLGTQFHPELTSRPLTAHPLFLEFVKAAAKRRK
jgi:CTP synthase